MRSEVNCLGKQEDLLGSAQAPGGPDVLCTKVRAGDLPDGSATKHACAAQNHGAKDEVGDICAGGEENIEKFEAAGRSHQGQQDHRKLFHGIPSFLNFLSWDVMEGRGFLICLYHTLEFSGIQWLNPVKIPI